VRSIAIGFALCLIMVGCNKTPAAPVATGNGAKIDQLAKEKAAIEAQIAQLQSQFNVEKAIFDKSPEAKAHMERIGLATRKLNEEFEKSPAAMEFTKKVAPLREKFTAETQKLTKVKDQIVEAASKG